MTKTFGALLFTLAIIGFGCSEEQNPAADSSPIDRPLSLALTEQLGNGQRSLMLHAVTEQFYDCANASIIAQPVVSGQTVGITFMNVLQPSDCTGPRGPATADINLGLLASGTYRFPLRVNSDSTAATLVVTDTTYQVNNGEGRWTTFTRAYIHKVPADAIWGDVEYNDPSSSAAHVFRDSLAALGVHSHRYPPENYGYFQVTDTSIVVPQHSTFFADAFIFQYGGNMLLLRNLVKRFGKTYKNTDVTVNLYGPHGEFYKSTALANEP